MFTRTAALRFDRRGRIAGLLLVALLLLSLLPAATPQAGAINLNVVYDDTVPGAVKPCSDPAYAACKDGVDRTADMVLLVQVAAAYWASIFHDSHLYDIRVAWKVGGLPSAQTTNIDANGRPTAAIVRVPADFNFWYDPTPFDDDEFDMQPRLYRDTHPAEQAEAFKGAPPEIFEVGYNGAGPSIDLLTILLHEIGHAIGLNADVAKAGRAPSCIEESYPYYDLDPDLLGGANMSLKAFEQFGEFGFTDQSHDNHDDDDHREPGRIGDLTNDPGREEQAAGNINKPSLGFDCSHLALGGIKACGDDAICKSHQALLWPGMLPNARSRPSIADILATAVAAGWEEVHLPRKYSLDSGLWADGETWLGARVPNAGNNVYILNREKQVKITLYELGTARDVLITDGNTLDVTFGTLDAYRLTMDGDGTTVLADSGAVIDVVYLTNGAGGLLDLANGAYVDAFWTLTNDGILRGGGGSVVEAHTFVNHGTIRANGGVFTIRSSQNGPALDIDGVAEWPHNKSVEALAGDLVFDGVIHDPVHAAVKVGAGHSVTFVHGWQQAYTGNPVTALQLNGVQADATVHGDSHLAGMVIVDGRGRFTSDVVLPQYSRLQLNLEGLTPVSGHDQVVIEQHVTLGGTLELLHGELPANPGGGPVFVTPGFEPQAGHEFVIMTYASRSGEFVELIGWDLGAVRLYPEYSATELRIVAKLVGDANGDGQLTNQDKGALAQSFGPCAPDPIPCVADINADGVIDQTDLQLLQDMLK